MTQVLHLDIKPANILLDESGTCPRAAGAPVGCPLSFLRLVCGNSSTKLSNKMSFYLPTIPRMSTSVKLALSLSLVQCGCEHMWSPTVDPRLLLCGDAFSARMQMSAWPST